MTTFPRDFTWGVATSAYQIEGAVAEGGRGPSIWDTFCARPGAIRDGSSGAVACDHAHRMAEDIALMRRLGVGAYRFSVAWPRVVPGGTGRVEPRGLDLYERLVDGLLAAGITPWATLYHWDLPQPLEDAGGWPARATAEAFVPYAEAVVRRLGDRVKHWITHNEPWCVAMLGYQVGEHAPGRKDPAAALAAAHHVLLSHGLAVPVIRAFSPGAQVGITLNFTPTEAASPAHADAARRFDGWFNRWFLDPVSGRGYPADVLADRVADGHLPPGTPEWLHPGDLDVIAAPTDFLGVNYYTREVVGGRGGGPRTDIDWEIHPASLERLLTRLSHHHRRLVITENGAAFHDAPGPDGRVRDARRVRYLAEHLDAVHRAIAKGAPVTGYFAWSLMDNFEWAHGYGQRFGLVWVDYATQARVLKDSARFYAEVIAHNAVPAVVEAG